MRTADFTIGTLSRRTGVHIETIRYYERIGILPKPPRTDSGRRLYDERFVKRLAFIARSRQLGFSLNEIRDLLSLVDEHSYTCADVRKMTLDHAAEARRKIADLQRLERALTDLAGQCTGEKVPECPIVEVLFSGAPGTFAPPQTRRR
jgi:MerR family mercuric resistance operon transcriptional regulator